ncbi:hypothetical protein TWF481_006552 [Arthrobotrys musiformis]|uniref:ABA 3 protein n=1 Tax=Arthrobotrys musiformis TaxID=47236 RepID=A0AAV9WAS7_9PEZI
MPTEIGAGGLPPGPPPMPTATLPKSRWFYPNELKNDLAGLNISDELRDEILNCAWEYTRCIIPTWTNWQRYIAFARIIILQAICEFRGDLVRPDETDEILGYKLQELIDILFAGSPDYVHDGMARELRTFFVTISEKASAAKKDSELFRRYTNALAYSAKDYFRMRDCDASVRFTIAAAWACNDIGMSMDKYWFSEGQWQVLAEICIGQYDAVAYFKHRAEGEICNFYAYAGGDMRLEIAHLYREILWALDSAWAQEPDNNCTHILTFLRQFSGAIHMLMRRYRFVEEGLTIGRPENTETVAGARRNVNLWCRIDAETQKSPHRPDLAEAMRPTGAQTLKTERYNAFLAQKDKIMYEGFAESLERSDTIQCKNCVRKDTYCAEEMYQFGGVTLCSGCQRKWVEYARSLPGRVAKEFPEMKTLKAYWD